MASRTWASKRLKGRERLVERGVSATASSLESRQSTRGTAPGYSPLGQTNGKSKVRECKEKSERTLAASLPFPMVRNRDKAKGKHACILRTVPVHTPSAPRIMTPGPITSAPLSNKGATAMYTVPWPSSLVLAPLDTPAKCTPNTEPNHDVPCDTSLTPVKITQAYVRTSGIS